LGKWGIDISDIMFFIGLVMLFAGLWALKSLWVGLLFVGLILICVSFIGAIRGRKDNMPGKKKES